MDTPRKLIVGYDLCEDTTQISCYSYKSLEPIPINTGSGEENCLIPTVLCVKTDTKQWLYGEEAKACALAGEGVLVDHLLTKVLSQEETEILGQKFSAVDLLEKFFRRSLTLIKSYFPTETITKMVVTVRRTAPTLVEGIYEALDLLGIEKDRITVLSHAGAYLYYTLSQDKAIWMNDVGLFDFNEEGLLYYQISINRRTKPMIAGIAKSEFTHLLNYDMLKSNSSNSPYQFENIANTTLYKQIISTLYFTGNGFEGGWADGVVRSLCAGRRVFFGQNLYTKGACYAARELTEDKSLSDFFILNDDMITGSIGINVYCDTKFKEMTLAEAGTNWFEVHKSIEVIPEGDAELELVIKKIMTREVIRKKVPLKALPERPNRMTRLEIEVSFKDKSTVVIALKDLGFGELYQGAGVIMEFTMDI